MTPLTTTLQCPEPADHEAHRWAWSNVTGPWNGSRQHWCNGRPTPEKANLALATTGELVKELSARSEVRRWWFVRPRRTNSARIWFDEPRQEPEPWAPICRCGAWHLPLVGEVSPDQIAVTDDATGLWHTTAKCGPEQMVKAVRDER